MWLGLFFTNGIGEFSFAEGSFFETLYFWDAIHKKRDRTHESDVTRLCVKFEIARKC